jgi:hypothetical protein
MRYTKKNCKCPKFSSCGHCVEHLVCIIWKSCYMLIPTGFLPKPCMIICDHHSCTSSASNKALWHWLKWCNEQKFHHAEPKDTTMPLILSITLWAISPCQLARLHSPTHASTLPSSRLARHWPQDARPDKPRTCQARGERALGRARVSRVPSLPSSPCIPTTATSPATLSYTA